MNQQQKAWKTRKRQEIEEVLCVVCKTKPVSSNKSKTCSRSCSAKLAWITGKKK